MKGNKSNCGKKISLTPEFYLLQVMLNLHMIYRVIVIVLV